MDWSLRLQILYMWEKKKSQPTVVRNTPPHTKIGDHHAISNKLHLLAVEVGTIKAKS